MRTKTSRLASASFFFAVAALLFFPPPMERSDCEAAGADYRIIDSFPHDPEAFTQGLDYHEGYFYESTGLNGKSSVRKVEPETGKVVKKVDLPAALFGEGLTLWKNRIVQLTWQSRIGFVYDLETFRKIGEFTYPTEGWGITQDGTSLIMSDGSDVLHFLDPDSYVETRRVEVRERGVPVTHLNELEYVKGEVLANVWQTDTIVRIDPRTGEVSGRVDLSGLRMALGPVRNIDVLNGIAYDSRGDRLFVTGKLWPRIFQIELPRH